MASLKAKLKGISPMIMHNGQLSDPSNRFSKAIKEISGKRKKTDADHEEMGRLEWYGSLYSNAKGGLVIPADNLDATIINGAKKSKMGSIAKSSIWVTNDAELIHENAGLTIDQLWAKEDHKFVKAVKIGTSKVMRTRPIFKEWECQIDIEFDELQINRSQLISILNDAGKMVGIGDWRPRYGRFEVEVI
jgi:hypothetical protein